MAPSSKSCSGNKDRNATHVVIMHLPLRSDPPSEPLLSGDPRLVFTRRRLPHRLGDCGALVGERAELDTVVGSGEEDQRPSLVLSLLSRGRPEVGA